MSEIRPIRHVGAPFAALHDALVDVRVDFEPLRVMPLSPELRHEALAAWNYRVHTEFRSIQTMARFLAETMGAGDPLEVYAGAVDAARDELRHTALCVKMVETLGGTPTFPNPIEEPQHPEFLALPSAGRALATAVGMLAISETLSVVLIEDLRDRCHHPTVRAVLDATLADEDHHRDYGWEYVRSSLGRFDEDGRELARMVAERTLAPHVAETRRVLDEVPFDRRSLDCFAEPELAALGLMSRERQALLFQHTIDAVIWPRLAALGIG